ncbi:zinc finger CCCH domain-containing protein 55 [Phtheirospermum japonicum]|uniref:Zinc finger CCCH domain-containing protein 55 n=1 Tax=Phtheirospermum japonicum TaxID=374723 RepID=A0A830CN38_9LAMI|nr:zinc finger CCCH domain-containing protein 55 [Phtheirospermum japonicum]
MVDPMMSPSGRSDSLIFPYGEDAHGVPSPHPHPFHRRSCSVNDAVFLSSLEEGGGGNGLGWRPCMYFARGFCKNGSSCKFLHGDNGEMMEAGSPSSTASGFDEYLRMKAIQQQRFAAMASGGHHSFPYNKSMGLGAGFSSSSRQIYLTFPADSTFKEEDVSSYFSMFGPVQDVRIPFQPKRMFGFVTFVYPETVKLILAKGNPHYVCDSRVLVKPYKEKGKFPEKKQLQQQQEHLERGCLSPSGVDSRELFDVPIGSRFLFNTQEMMFRRKLEQEAEIQHALDLQSRRMNNMNLVDLENPQHNSHRFLPSLFSGAPISSPRQQQLLMGQNFIVSPDATNQDALQDDVREASKSPAFAADDEKSVLEGTESSTNNYILSSKKHQHVNDDDPYLFESMEHILPDNLFASPTKLAADQQSGFSAEADNNIPMTNTTPNNSPLVASSSPLRMASLFYSETKRYTPFFFWLFLC